MKANAMYRIGSCALICLLPWLALTGCVPELKSEAPPERIYWLETTAVPDSPPVRLRVSVVPGLESDRIWLLEQDRRLNFYAGAFWPDNLSPLLESLITRSLGERRDGPVMEVLVERFFALQGTAGAPPEVEVRALLRNRGTTCRFEHTRPAATDRLRDVVAAHQFLLDALTGAVAEMVRSGDCPRS